MVQMARLKVGDEAPDFTLPSQEGIYVTLSKFRGERNVVLYFYPKDGSPGCTAQACSFRDSHEVFMGLGQRFWESVRTASNPTGSSPRPISSHSSS
jgi:peroxiredoxin